MKDIYDLLGRIMLSVIFFYEAYDTMVNKLDTKELMSFYGFTWKQNFLFYGAVVVLFLGALLVLLGYRTGLGVIMLLTYWVPVTFTVYSFWEASPDKRGFESLMFMKNLAIIGGLLMLAANGAGRFSVKRLLATTKVPQAPW